MDIPEKAWIPLGVITAAVIAGMISLVNILIAKDEKITAFRQEWINSLRNEIAHLVALTSTISSLRHIIGLLQDKQDTRGEALNEMRSVLKTESAQSLECRNRIRLYLNPEKDKDIINKIESLYEASKVSSDTEHERVKELCESVLTESQRVLKKEWKRVKSGEPSYVVMKFVLYLIFPILFVILLAILVRGA